MKIRIPRFRDVKADSGDSAIPVGLAPDDRAAGKAVIHIDGSKFMAMLTDIATNAWKAQVRLKNWPTEESPTERKRLERNIDAIAECLQDFGVRVKDHTGEAYDYGQPIKVVAAQPQVGIEREVVTETIRPSVFWDEHILQRGEVVIATPVEAEG